MIEERAERSIGKRPGQDEREVHQRDSKRNVDLRGHIANHREQEGGVREAEAEPDQNLRAR